MTYIIRNYLLFLNSLKFGDTTQKVWPIPSMLSQTIKTSSIFPLLRYLSKGKCSGLSISLSLILSSDSVLVILTPN